MQAWERPSVATLEDRRREPTSTATLRDRYEAELYKRFQAVKGLVRETVEKNDALRLSATMADAVRDFEFDSDSGKEAAFMQWMERTLDSEVLEPIDRTDVARGSHYTSEYVRAASRQGADYAAEQLRKEGVDITAEQIAASFDAGEHRDKLETLYLRNYAALDGITDAVDTEIARELSEGIAAGKSPRDMGRTLNDRVSSIGITRARTMAQTETMHAHHTHAGVRYADAGVEEFDVLPFDPCPVCQDLVANNPHPVDEIASILPAHPRCVCGVTPRL